MAYLGTPPRSRVLSSADIDPGSVSLDDISFTDQPTSVNVSGTIDKHTMRLSDQVVIDGDLDISDNLILSKISDDGNAITLTNDSSTRTITGTGSLEASTLTQTPNASLTGMTGEIGSAVTGSPNLNLTTGTIGTGVTFPAGHVIQSKFINIGSAYASGNISRENSSSNPPGAEVHANLRMTCSSIPSVSNKVIKVQYSIFVAHENHPQFHIVHSWDNSSWTKSPRGVEDSAGMTWGNSYDRYPHAMGGYESDVNKVDSLLVTSIWTDTTSSNNTLYTRLYWQSQNSTSHVFLNRTRDNNSTHGGLANSTGSIYIFQG
jgi:hypothetical protein